MPLIGNSRTCWINGGMTSETLSELFERSEIDESALLGKAIPHPAQVNSVK